MNDVRLTCIEHDRDSLQGATHAPCVDHVLTFVHTRVLVHTHVFIFVHTYVFIFVHTLVSGYGVGLVASVTGELRNDGRETALMRPDAMSELEVCSVRALSDTRHTHCGALQTIDAEKVHRVRV